MTISEHRRVCVCGCDWCLAERREEDPYRTRLKVPVNHLLQKDQKPASAPPQIDTVSNVAGSIQPITPTHRQKRSVSTEPKTNKEKPNNKANGKPKPPTIEELEANNEAPWKTAPDADPYVDEVGLFDNVKDYIKRHVYFRDPILYDVVTAWIFATYHMKKWRALGILLWTGPIGSGKTTGLEILEELAYRGVRSGSMSNPVQFRMREDHQPTFLIDEAQLYNQDDWAELRGALNESYKRGGKVWRMIGEGSGMTYKCFKVYGATALALSDQPWEAMEARGLKIKMEKVPREERTKFKETLTEEFYDQGARLRGQLRQYRTRFEKLQPAETDLDKLIEKIEAAKTPHERSSIVTNPFPDPMPSLEEVKDPRTREIGYPLVVVAPDTGPRDNIVRYLKDLEAAHEADENTGYTADIFRAFSQASVEGGKVSISDVRAQLMIIWDIEKLTDKRMPHPKTVINALKTMGFNPTRTSRGTAAVFYDPDLIKGLATRYGISSVSSSSSSSSGANGANGANQEGGEGPCRICGKHALRIAGRDGVSLVCKPCFDKGSDPREVS